MNSLTTQAFNLTPRTFDEALTFARMIAKSSFVPKQFQNKPEDVLIAIQMGNEIGLPPLQALQSIAVINGRPCVWGDGALAVVQNHPHYEWMTETTDDEGAAVCIIKRKNHEAQTVRFSEEDAKKARLWGKQGPWSDYPKRMMQMRARAFALRNVFSDALKGLSIREEVEDYDVKPIVARRAYDKGKAPVNIGMEEALAMPLPTPSEVLEKHGLTDPNSIQSLECLLDWVMLIKGLQLSEGEKRVLRDMYSIRKLELTDADLIEKQEAADMKEQLGVG